MEMQTEELACDEDSFGPLALSKLEVKQVSVALSVIAIVGFTR